MVTTAQTTDPDAKHINLMSNPVRKAIQVGQLLREVFHGRFHSDRRTFGRWVSQNLDISTETAHRWRVLAENSEKIPKDAIRLIDLYHQLGIAGLPGSGGSAIK